MNTPDLFDLSGRVALVTGGAGLYGRQIVAGLAEAGATVYTAARNLTALQDLAAEYATLGHDIRPLQYDQGDETSILNMVEALMSDAGHVDILVNNAVARTMKSWDDPAANFARSMHINATGLFILTRAVGDAMAAQGSGSIVNIASIQGIVGPDAELYKGCSFSGFIPDYFFHKGGMVNFTRYVAAQYGPQGVRCNCLSPGGYFNDHPEPFLSNYSASTFLGRMADDDDLKGAVVFLASDAARYVTGTNLPVDGGYTAH